MALSNHTRQPIILRMRLLGVSQGTDGSPVTYELLTFNKVLVVSYPQFPSYRIRAPFSDYVWRPGVNGWSRVCKALGKTKQETKHTTHTQN